MYELVGVCRTVCVCVQMCIKEERGHVRSVCRRESLERGRMNSCVTERPAHKVGS